MVNIIKRGNERGETGVAEQHPLSIIDRFFDDSFFEPFLTLSPGVFRNRSISNVSTMFPKVDVTETDTEITVRANVPGIDPEKIDIEVGDDYLSLSGTVEKEEKEEEKGKVYRYEREYGEFHRSFALPARVKKDGIVAKAKNGVLTITIPKSEEDRRAKVKVEVER